MFDVFDASVKVVDDLSLNYILHKGPCLLPNLYDLLLAFRAKPIALTGNIDKAILKIVVHVVYGLKIYLTGTH